jgi:hypothetical protein
MSETVKDWGDTYREVPLEAAIEAAQAQMPACSWRRALFRHEGE